MNRRLCSKCGLDYNLIFHRPANPAVCDVCGGPLLTRADDNRDALVASLHDYRTKTRPILDLFSRKELIVSVDGSKPADVVQKELRAKLGLEKAGSVN
jgi:adenylate kinase